MTKKELLAHIEALEARVATLQRTLEMLAARPIEPRYVQPPLDMKGAVVKAANANNLNLTTAQLLSLVAAGYSNFRCQQSNTRPE